MSTSRQAYDTDLTDAQWAIIRVPLMNYSGRGRPMQYELREIVNGILYIVRAGCQWRNLPHDLPKWQSVYHHFQKWCRHGVWEDANTLLRQAERQNQGRTPEPTGAIVDSQSVKTTEAGGERGIDGGKNVNGRKRNILTDTLGLLLAAVVNAANTGDRAGAKALFSKLTPETLASLEKVWADNGYSGPSFADWLQDNVGATVEITSRPPNEKGFVVVPFRWIVERTFAWLGRNRRLSKDFEHTISSSQGFLYVASISFLLKRLATPA